MKKSTLSLVAKIALVTATLIWGASFIVVKDMTDTLPPLLLLACRFLPASLLMAIVFAGRLKKLNFGYLWRGSVMGMLLFFAYTFQTYGITDTTPGKNAFLTGVYCIIVPFLAWLLSHKRPDRYNVTAAFLCIIGIGFVSLNGDFSMRLGDILTLICGLFYAFHIIVSADYTEEYDPMLLSILQFAVNGFCALIASCIVHPEAFTAVTVAGGLVWSILYLTVGSTAIGLSLQCFGQKYVEPSTAALLLSLESVFGVVFSVIMGAETLTVKVVIGFVLIFAAIVISETKLAFLHTK